MVLKIFCRQIEEVASVDVNKHSINNLLAADEQDTIHSGHQYCNYYSDEFELYSANYHDKVDQKYQTQQKQHL